MRVADPARVTLLFAAVAAALDVAGVLLPTWATSGAPTGVGHLLTLPATPAPLVGHLAATAVLGSVWWELPRLRGPGTVLVLVLTGALGPAGALTALLAASVALLVPARPMHSQDVGVDEEPEPWSEVLAESGELEPASLCDVFRHGALSQRRTAVALIGANFRPELGVALRMALEDEHNAIRVQAGMVMQTLEDRFVSDERAHRAQAAAAFDSHGFGDQDAMRKLAELYDQWAFAGLLDERRLAETRGRALHAYRRHLEAFPTDLRVIAAVGRLFVRAGESRRAADYLTAELAKGHVSAAIAMWAVEALYRAGRYDELQTTLEAHGELVADRLPESSVFRGVIALWQQRPQPVTLSVMDEITARHAASEPHELEEPEDEDAWQRALRRGRFDA